MRFLAGPALAAVLVAGVRPAAADCLLEETPNTLSDNLTVVYPNWQKALVAEFNLTVCTDGVCPGTPNCNITGVTVYNYGDATGLTDLSAMYFNMSCGKTSVWQTMTYAGVWAGAVNHPAWTWVGNMAWGSDPQFSCASTPSLSFYADVAPCPTDGAEVTIGLGFNDFLDPLRPGGVTDACGCQVPSWDEPRAGRTKFIRYATKITDKTIVAPGDTVTYTLYYGRPGAGLTNVIVTDSLPVTTHYVAGSAVPAPDAGWDPDPGPPMKLRWTLPGGATTGGPTGELRFRVTVDWGNGEAFEPGSGDVAAVEGARLDNMAAVEFPGSGCGTQVSPPAGAIVRRHLMWKVADQDILFAPRLGQPDDEITYSIFLRNESAAKTWWNVRIWDTVPPELDAWSPGAGFWDACAGAWTMTPSGGCSPGGPGFQANAVRTLLTWTLDLGPGETRSIEWRARVKVAGVTAGATATSKVSVLALGAPGTIGGTGHAGRPRTFVHMAAIVLRTTYFSYVGQASASVSCGDPPFGGLKISFYPMNKAANFELRKLFYEGAGTFAANGGKSASIVAMQGTCAGGFADGGYPGCGPERAPSQYFMPPPCPATPNAILYKLTANVPVLWMLMPGIGAGGDAFTYLPATSLTHAGFALYGNRRCVEGAVNGVCSDLPGYGESWVVFNASINETGTFDPGLVTTAHAFKWDAATLSWQYVAGSDIDPTSLWMPFAGCSSVNDGHWRIISSDARLLVYQGYGTIGDPTGIPYAYNEHGNLVPTAENGLKVSQPGGPATFYAVLYHDAASNINAMVGNCTPGTDATYRVYRYRPRYPGLAMTGIPPSLAGNSGSWDLFGIRTADAGLAGPDNPHVWGTGPYDKLTQGTGGTANAWKFEWQSGGTICLNGGANMMRDWGGGSVIHTADGKSAGQDFWFHQYGNPDSWAILAFCHSAGMAVQAVSNQGFTATYTTDGPDQCIGFMNLPSAKADHIVYRVQLLAGGTQGDVISMYHQTQYREKFFTAPFVATGVHYDIIAPPVVYTGQSFWITVLVVMNTGTTKIDYCGTTSFTSTDPGAKLEGTALDVYNFTWSAAGVCSAPPDENGVKVFVNVVFFKLGLQSLVAGDTIDGSINGVTAINVVGADIKLEKVPRLALAASADTVQFRICWSNYSSASAFTFVITDAVPVGTTFLPEAGTWALHCGATTAAPLQVSYSTATTPTMPAAASFVAANPVAGTRWLRWTIPVIGVNQTGCACFRVTVN